MNNDFQEQIQELAYIYGFDIKLNQNYSEVGVVDKINISLSKDVITHKSPPKGYPDSKEKYADPANYKYPVDTESRVRAAWSYINMPRNQSGYSPAEISAIKLKIKSAGKKFGIKFSEDNK